MDEKLIISPNLVTSPPKNVCRRREGAKSRRSFTNDVKQMIIDQHFNEKIPIAALSRTYGIAATTLHTWKYHADRVRQQAKDRPKAKRLFPKIGQLKHPELEKPLFKHRMNILLEKCGK